MHLLELHYRNAKANGTGSFRAAQGPEGLAKWTVLGTDAKSLELIRLMALACGGVPFISRVAAEARTLSRDPAAPLDLEFVVARHAPHDGLAEDSASVASAVRFPPSGEPVWLPRARCESLGPESRVRQLPLGPGNGPFFCLGYGPNPCPKQEDDFDFEDPFHRVSRFLSLFRAEAGLTHPSAFLTRLHYKAVRAARFPAQQAARRLTDRFAARLGLDIAVWWTKDCRIDRAWEGLPAWQQRLLLPILDAVRHALDAFPRLGQPLTAPGVVLLDRPHRFCSKRLWASWAQLLNDLLPNMQFVATLPPSVARQLPPSIRRAVLAPALVHPPPTRPPRPRVPPGGVLLIDVDGRLPNVALMKLSRHFKLRGRTVRLARQEAYLSSGREVWASCVFHRPAALRRVERMRAWYGARFQVGGSGVDLNQRLPAEVESLEADYDLYPELGDRAIGFLTRGCPSSCPFCVVPRKEGRPRQVTDLEALLQGRNKLILLDDNLLAYGRAAELLEEMIRREIQVNFNQTLDIRLLTDETAGLLRRVRCRDVTFHRDNHYFSLNDTRHLATVARQYRRLGFESSDNVEFICMYGFNTTLAEDLERFRFLKSLPGAYVFVQEYQPFPGAPPARLEGFFDSEADRQIAELVGLVYKQNMKSMEKYYRWLSRRYALTFGRLHPRLVDTIFRYNNRHAKGRYLATLAGTREG